MVIHSRRKTERKPIEKPVQKMEVATSGYVSTMDESPAIEGYITKAASSDEQVNKKPRKKKKKA